MTTPRPAAPELRLGVGALALEAAGVGGRGFAGRGGRRAAWLGAALHAAYQREAAARDATFEAEVALSHRREHGGWRIALHGRADGVRGEAGRRVVVECKSLRPGAAPSPALRRAYELQAAWYAWMLGEREGAVARAHLVWLPTDGSPAREEPVRLDADAAERALREALDAAVAAAEVNEARRLRWRAAAATVRFPHPRARPGQREIARAVERAVEEGEHLLVEAPTGIGKTAALLTPLLRAALADDLRVLFLTAAGLQQRLAVATLRRLAPPGVATAVRLRAKARACATGELLCHPLACEYARDYGRKVREGALVARVLAAGVATPGALGTLARSARVCPVELAFDAAREAAVTVADLNYAFDPVVALSELAEPGALARTVIAVDEVHRLPDRARASRSAVLTAAEARAAADATALGGSPLHREQRELAEATARLVEDPARELLGPPPGMEPRWLEGGPAPEALAALGNALDDGVARTLDALGGEPARGPAAAFLDLAFAVARLRQALAAPDALVVPEVGHLPEGAALRALCLDASPALARLLGGARAMVGASATLAPATATRDLLGLDPDRFAHVEVPARDLEDRLCVVIDATVSTAYRDRARQTPRIARRLRALAEATPGNVLALAPSHARAAALAAALPPGRHRLRLARPEDGEREREAWLAELAETDDLLTLAVAGGALAEGVDTAGRLSAVAVVGPCLPAPDDERRRLADHYEERFGDGFELAYAVPGMRRVVQAAGRLLRGPGDRGVLALLGRRFLRAPFRELLPAAWLGGGPPEDRVGDPAAAAAAFFADLAP